jgi:hypothetical protein
MTQGTTQTYLEPTQESGQAFFTRGISGAATFVAFASDRDYLSGIGHRTAALEDSRLLPLIEGV